MDEHKNKPKNKNPNDGCLVLTRKEGEAVVIGDHLTVTVSRLKENEVRLAFRGPKNIPIFRMEVWLKLQAQKKEEEKKS
ncbi:MAG: carbon storage regulator [Dehalococcoidia bacterium]|nr:carbon storage regulator [Dehalococcoidia bacterium]